MTNRIVDEALDTSHGNRVSLRQELMAVIESWGFELPSDLDDQTSLIASGIFDSLALFNLSVWIESKIGGHRASIGPSKQSALGDTRLLDLDSGDIRVLYSTIG